MSPVQKLGIVALALLAHVVGFWLGQDYGRYDEKLDRCIAAGGDGLTRARECFKRQAVAVPYS